MEIKDPSTHPLVLAIITVGLLCRLTFVWFTPTFYAPDEQAHFSYIKHLAEDHAFPVMPLKQTDPATTLEYCQSPLYYLSMVPLYRAAQFVFTDTGATVRFLRFFSVLLWLLNVWLGSLLLKQLRIKDCFMWIFTIAMICLLPTYTFVSSAINNDNLLTPLSGGLLCLLVRHRQTLSHAILLGVLLGCALLTKQSAAVFFPVIALLSAQDCLSQRVRWSIGLWHLGVMVGIAVLMYMPWVSRNWVVYGSFTPEILPISHKVWPSAVYGIASAIHNLVKTFWAVSGIYNNVGYPFPVAGMILLLLCFVAPPPVWKNGLKFDTVVEAEDQPVMVAFLFAIAINIVLALRFGYVLGMGQGRHLFPVLCPIALLLAARLRLVPVKNLELYATGFWMLYAISFVVFSLCRFP